MNIMKLLKNMITVAALALTAAGLSSCYIRISNEQKARLKNDLRYTLNKDSDKDTVIFDVGEFNSISQKAALDDMFFVQTDGEYKVKIITYSGSEDSLSVKNDNGVLRIGFNASGSTLLPVQAWIYAPSIKEIQTAGSGNFTIADYSGDSLTITSAGSGDIKAFDLNLSGPLTVSGAGSGDQYFMHINAAELNISKAGSSDGEYSDINVGRLSMTSAGSGDTLISGKAESATISKKGSGEIDTSHLKVKDLNTED